MKLAEKLWGVLLVAMLLLMGGSYLLLRTNLSTLSGNELNVDRAVFNTVNAATLSGFRLAVTVQSYRLFGQAVIFTLISAGALVSLIVGGWAVVRICQLPFDDGQVARASVIAYVLAVLIGASALLGPGMSLWDAIFQAGSAFANAGQVIGTNPDFADWRTHVILLPLAFIGGLGIPVIIDLLSCLAVRRRPAVHSIAVLFMSAIIYLVGTGLILAIEAPSGAAQFRQTTVAASSEMMNDRTLGLPLDSLLALSRSSQWILMLVMAIGASTASTGGGIKTTTLYVLCRDTARLLRGKTVGRIFGVACAWAGIYLLIVLIATVLLVLNYPQEPGDRMLFLAISAASNVGTSHAPLTFTGNGLYILSGAMLLGRFAPLGILWWAATHARGADVAVA